MSKNVPSFPINEEHIEAELARLNVNILKSYRRMRFLTSVLGFLFGFYFVTAIVLAMRANLDCIGFGIAAPFAAIFFKRCAEDNADIRRRHFQDGILK